MKEVNVIKETHPRASPACRAAQAPPACPMSDPEPRAGARSGFAQSGVLGPLESVSPPHGGLLLERGTLASLAQFCAGTWAGPWRVWQSRPDSPGCGQAAWRRPQPPDRLPFKEPLGAQA